MLDDTTDESGFKGTSRGWVFTIHDYTEEQIRRGSVWLETPECIGISAGLEIAPTTGSKHIQGYVRLSDAVKKTAFWKIIGPNAKGKNRFWIKKANADWVANAKYTSKDNDLIWYKVPPAGHQGARTDLQEFHQAIKRKAKDDELFEDYLPILAKYPRLEGRLKSYYAKQATVEFREVERFTYWGPGGSGKSKKALYNGAGKRLPDTYIVPNTDNLKWWIDYEGEKTIVINEMNGAKCKYDRWKEIMDGGQLVLETKGSHTYANWTKVIMTTNNDPNTWWDVPGASMDHKEFERRVGEIVLFENDD